MIFKFRTLEQTNFPYQIEFSQEYDISEVTDWCIETFGKYNVIFEYYCIRLKEPEHLSWFKIRWL